MNTNRSCVLPSAMDEKLRSIRWRLTVISAAKAAAIAMAVLIVAMIVAMTVDWQWTLYDVGVRTALTAGSLSLATAALLTVGLPALLAVRRRTHAAAQADEHTPQLQERWTTVASITMSGNRPTTPTGEAMLRQVTSEAVAMQQLVQPSCVVRPALPRREAWTLSLCFVVLAGFLALDWRQTSVLLQRFWHPTADITATQLTSVTGDQVIPRGERIELTAQLAGVPRATAILELATPQGIVDLFELKPDLEKSNSFIHPMAVQESFRYRVRSGDGRTAWHMVSVIDYPSLGDIKLTVTPPEYAHRPKFEKTNIPSRLKVMQGSRLELAMKPTDPLQRLELTMTFEGEGEDEPQKQVLPLVAGAEGWYHFDTQLLQDVSLELALFNSHGLTNEDRYACRIEVVRDKAPVARIISPTDEVAVTADEVIDIKFEAHDDHAIASAELVVYEDSPDGGEQKILEVRPIPLGDQRMQKHLTASVQLDLETLEITKDANISYAIRVTDNRQVEVDPNALSANTAQAKPGERENDAWKDDVGNRTNLDQAPPANETEQSKAVASKAEQTKGQPGEPDASSTAGEPEMQQELADARDAIAKLAGKNDQNPKEAPAPDNVPNALKGDPQIENPSERSDTNQDQPSVVEDKSTLQTKGDLSENKAAQEGSIRKGESSEDPKTQEPTSGAIPPADSGAAEPRTTPEEGTGESGKQANESTLKDDRKATSADPKPSSETSKTQGDNQPSNPMTDSPEEPQTKRTAGSGGDSPPPSQELAMNPRQSQSGQDVETDRRKLKITERLSAVAAAGGPKRETTAIREKVVEIDKLLAAVETPLTRLVKDESSDVDRSEQFRQLDTQLGEIEAYVARLHEETQGGEFDFVGLQMVHITRIQVTPARDRVFIAIREPIGTDNPAVALHHVVRAREMLAALLQRYDRVTRDLQLAENLDKSVKMYEVYVEKMQELMREARQNRNPLERKMGIIEVDQDYLDRYAQVLTLRREMLAEFARMLGDDPRLLARYLDITARSRTSLRDQLSELAERQDEISAELSGWLQGDEDQRDDLWTIVSEMRLHAATPLAKEAADLAERIEQVMPLELTSDNHAAALVVQHARQIAELTRSIALEAKSSIEQAGDIEDASKLSADAERLVYLFTELDASLERLNFENQGGEEIETYVTNRLLESRTVADRADNFARVASHLQNRRYHGLAEVDQQDVAVATELLRVMMLDIETGLQNDFNQSEITLSPEIVDVIRQLHWVMEKIVFEQTGTAYAMTQNRLEDAETRQVKVAEGFRRAEELFDQIRQLTIAALDEADVDNPNIADLQDPTLDEFLARLEREPNIEARLGIPNRPRNFRVLAESMEEQQEGGDLLNESVEAALSRARQSKKMEETSEPENPSETTEEEREKLASMQQMKEMLEKSLASTKEKLNDPNLSPEERERLEQLAGNFEKMLEQAGGTAASDEEWERMAESDKAREILRALATGEKIPDDQWNKLLSTLGDGLWQVKGRTPPADYRKAIQQYQDRIRQLVDTTGGTQ